MTSDGTRSLGEWAERRLRLAILTGELQPGDQLAPSKLAREWEMSLTPLREAVHRLSAEGLIEESRHRGARIRPLTVEDLRDLYQFRLLVEPLALKESLQASDDEHRAQMNAAFDRWAAAATDSSLDKLTVEETHRAFHRSLLSCCRSSRLMQAVDTLSHQSARYRILAATTGRGGATVAHREHQALLEHCVAGRVSAAVDQLRAHLKFTLDHLVENACLPSLSSADVREMVAATPEPGFAGR